MNSKIFSPRYRAEMEKRALGILKKNSKIMSAHTVESPRAVGDAVEKILADNIEYIVGARGREFSAQFARRAMADMAFLRPSTVSTASWMSKPTGRTRILACPN